jgi:hypothetical protein
LSNAIKVVGKVLKAFWKQWRITKWRKIARATLILGRWRPCMHGTTFLLKLHICPYSMSLPGMVHLRRWFDWSMGQELKQALCVFYHAVLYWNRMISLEAMQWVYI